MPTGHRTAIEIDESRGQWAVCDHDLCEDCRAKLCRLLVGIIYARDLEQYEAAEGHLKLALDSLIDDGRKKQCQQWLDRVTALLRPASPDAG